MTEIPSKRFFRPDEVATILEEPLRNIYRWMNDGLIQHFQIGNKRKVTRDELLRLLSEGTKQAKEASVEVLQEMANKNKKHCCVYIINGNNGLYKIGMTSGLRSRLKILCESVPFKIDLVGIIKTEDHKKLESQLHVKFKNCRVKGEWFLLSDSDLEEIKSMDSFVLVDLPIDEYIKIM